MVVEAGEGTSDSDTPWNGVILMKTKINPQNVAAISYLEVSSLS